MEIEYLLYITTIYYLSGNNEEVYIDFSRKENISGSVELIYVFWELPLLEAEDKIYKEIDKY